MKKQSRIVKFSISIRKETREMLDKKANDENRSRSSLIDIICSNVLIKELNIIPKDYYKNSVK